MSIEDPFALIARTMSERRPIPRGRLSLYVALGDSFTAGTGSNPGEAWPERLAAVHQDCLFHAARPTVVHEQRLAVQEPPHQPQSPQRRRTPLASRCLAIRPVVRERVAHVVQQQV